MRSRTSCERLSCHTTIGLSGLPVSASHASTDSPWWSSPHATTSSSADSSSSATASTTAWSTASAFCSTHPGRGWAFTLSRRASRTGWSRSSNSAALTPVVPSSIPRRSMALPTTAGLPPVRLAAMKLEDLRKPVDDGSIDTVLLCIADMEGRLQGKRLTAQHFLDEVVEHDAEGCNYLLAVDVDMNTVDGYAMSSWERGYGDFVFKPDMDTLREIAWHPATVLLMADLAWEDGSEVVASPRQILRRQLARLGERGWTAAAGTELEFIVFRDSYEEAWKKGYRDLDPANYYNVDYSLLGTARIEPLLRRIRNSMMVADMSVENSKGECNFGQHEINFRYDDALQTADNHVIYKSAAKEIAAQEGYAITFIAKLDEREGNSCHIHCSLQNEGGGSVFADDDTTFHR